jgi:putative peptidoglycan lipid II flippase
MSADSIGRRMGRATLVMVVSVLLSRVMGFVREMVIAAHAGASAETDVYFAAFTIPDFLNHLLAGGALSITFIPIFSRYLAEGDEAEGWRVTSVVVTNMTAIALPAIALLMIFAEELVPLIAPGFDTARRAACAYLVRIILPAQYLFYVGGVLMAVQYAHERFLLPALAPIVYNLGIIAGGLALAPWIGMDGFCWGVLAGAFAGNFALQILGARRVGLRFAPSLRFRDPAFLEFLKLSLPLMLGLSLILADEWIGKALGSYLAAASISWLNYARTLMRIPTAVVGQAAGVASFPFLSRLAAEGKKAELERTLGQALRCVLTFIVPASALCAVLGREMAIVLFGRGRFTTADAAAVGDTLFWFSLGIFAWGAQGILARGFYALKDTLTPTLVGTLFTAAVLPLSWVLMGPMAQEGLALASSIGIVGYALSLYWLFHRRLAGCGAAGEAARNAAHFAKVLVGSAAAGLAAHGFLHALGDAVPWSTLWGSLLRCALGGLAAALVYTAAALALRVEGFSRVLGRLGRAAPR